MRKTIVIFISLLAFIGLACGLSFPKTDNKKAEWPTPSVSEEEAQKFEQNVQAAGDQLNANEPVVLVVTESELTSFATLQLQKLEVSAFVEPQIYLRDGKVQVFGKYVEAASVDISVKLGLLVSDGLLKIQIDAITLNGFTAPDQLAKKVQLAIAEQVEPALNQWLVGGMYVDKIEIGDGILTITGHNPK